jgi:anionic cell wall polymer biosynthesis LytR-Cps2A-Psr (LCP) family protein
LIVEDSNNDQPSSGAQLIRVLQMDFDRHELLVVPFSAYLEIDTPALEQGYGIRQSSLQSVYNSVQQTASDLSTGHSDASQAVEQVIFDHFGISTDHFLSINESFFLQLSQWLGPIQIENPGSFATRLFEYPRGPAILTEANIWDYLVYSEGTVDEYFRLMRQDIVLKAVFETIQAKFNRQEIEAWLNNLQDPIITDLPISELANSMCVFDGSKGDNVQFTQLPYDIFELTLEKMIVTDPNLAKSYLHDLFTSVQ